MALGTTHTNALSPLRIAGFACNQGFLYFLFYMGANRAYALGDIIFERSDLLATLLFMVLTLFLWRFVPERAKNILLSRPALLVYALMLAGGTFLTSFFDELAAFWILLDGLCVGLSLGLLLIAWGKTFGGVSTKISVPEVFFGSVIGAMAGLIVSLIPFDQSIYLLYVFPFGSALALFPFIKSFDELWSGAIADEYKTDTAILSAKIIAGTVLFGIAAGLMGAFNTDPGQPEMISYPASFILFGGFAIGTLSLLLSDGFGRGASLNKAYRLALFIVMVGLLLIPMPQFAESLVPGESIYLAGYLGLMAVLISLFLVLANLTAVDTSVALSRGLTALFGGELVGVCLANVMNATDPTLSTPYTVVVIAGILVLLSYIFLFTERDFASLSEIVSNTDSFEDVCQKMVETYSLSNREAELLPLALKGRTSERIAQELHISKSTVDTHLRRIYAKTDVHSRQELIDLKEGTVLFGPFGPNRTVPKAR